MDFADFIFGVESKGKIEKLEKLQKLQKEGKG